MLAILTTHPIQYQVPLWKALAKDGRVPFEVWYLTKHGIQPSLSEWSSELDFIQNRLKTEIFNQALGVAKGDEVEAQRDPQIQRAVELIAGH